MSQGWSLELSEGDDPGCTVKVGKVGDASDDGDVGDRGDRGGRVDNRLMESAEILSATLSGEVRVVRGTLIPKLWAIWMNCLSTSSSVMPFSKRNTVIL